MIRRCIAALVLAAGPLEAQDEGKFYAAEFSSAPTLRVIDVDSGAETGAVPLALSQPTDFATAPDGSLYATTFGGLFRVDPATGTTTFIGNHNVSNVNGLEFDCAGGAFVVTTNGVFARLDVATAQSQPLATFAGVQFSGDIATLSENLFYATYTSTLGSRLARIDVSGMGTTFTDLGLVVQGRSLFGLDFDGFGRLVASDDAVPGAFYAITDLDGPLTVVPLATTMSLNGSIAGIASVVASGQQVAYCSASTSSCGTTPHMSVAGLPSASAGSGFVLTATNLPANRAVGLFMTTNGRAMLPFGAGTLCVQGPFAIDLHFATGTPGACDAQVAVDVNALAMPAFLKQPGTIVQCQFVGRDRALPVLTEALEFSICQ